MVNPARGILWFLTAVLLAGGIVAEIGGHKAPSGLDLSGAAGSVEEILVGWGLLAGFLIALIAALATTAITTAVTTPNLGAIVRSPAR